ncbi:MAG: sulfonate ABC transporter substrate-binding protein [Rhodovulum sulfidophilum]|uniref:Putative aliphatic sulfonates-binding protein n=1 Tax=Rhodovulum sulfidophilum TaxID=35806 RepID=A0A2W5QAE6_RHOSU|nr:MAG: sulfonate ABC transporter substrate-binding protein [Rhodovulum sulfidophilum]
MNITRRAFGGALAGVGTVLALGGRAFAEEAVTEVKIGYQKTNLPVVARREGTIEAALGPDVSVKWVEFTAGPPLVEALNVGAVDLGWTGDAPPIFGQASGAAISYVAALPGNGAGEAIIVKADGGIETLADLRGKTVAVGKGTSAHNLLVAALEKAGVGYDEITPTYLAPADGAAAFAADKVDAWAVWDPFLAIAETRYAPRVLARSSDVLNVNTYFLGNKTFVAEHPSAVLKVLAGLGEAAVWADAHRPEVAAAVAEVTGVPIDAQTLAADRATFGIFEITPEIVAHQQETADRFFKLGLIPTAITVSDAVWPRPRA